AINGRRRGGSRVDHFALLGGLGKILFVCLKWLSCYAPHGVDDFPVANSLGGILCHLHLVLCLILDVVGHGLTSINSIVEAALALLANVAPRLDVRCSHVACSLEGRFDGVIAGSLDSGEGVT